jgi:carbamoyltransferase
MNSKNILVLGIKFGGHDCAAAIMLNGELIAAAEQERYTRDKHSRRFPIDAIKDCLAIAGVGMNELRLIAFVTDLRLFVREMYLRPALTSDQRLAFLFDDIEKIKQSLNMPSLIREKTGFEGEIRFYRHHLCHLASSYYPSGFENCLLTSFDGVGEIETGLFGTGRKGIIKVFGERVKYPHSLGLCYSALTYFLGWRHHSDEGIVMGLAPYGNSNALIPGNGRTYYEIFCEIIRETGALTYELDMSWFSYFEKRDIWVSDKFKNVFGDKRDSDALIEDHHKNIAAALQRRLEDIVLAEMKHARDISGQTKIAMAGGVALNCSLNGRVLSSGLFEEVFVQPAAGDAGAAIGACYLASKELIRSLMPKKNHNAYLGSRFSTKSVRSALEKNGLPFYEPKNLCEAVAKLLASGKVVAWFQGAAEFGPRALGNRSILTRPFPLGIRDHINNKVKFREAFRPLAPSVLADRASAYFQLSQPSPHMLMAVPARADKIGMMPAVVHIDGSCRVQTVSADENAIFYKLLESFEQLTGLPVLLNTSFNVKGQPIVNTPEEAIESFRTMNIDALAIDRFILEKQIL